MKDNDSPTSSSDVFGQRLKKLTQLREQGWNYPNTFRPRCQCAELAELPQEQWDSESVSVAGRLVAKRDMGSVIFLQLRDGSGAIQLYVGKKGLSTPSFAEVKHWDVGDIVGVEGHLFYTRTQELTIRADHLHLLVKNLHPLPEKHYGLSDIDQRYRRRYLDLLANQEVAQSFRVRSKIIGLVRQFLSERGFLEVETPMLQPKPGGATAKPFSTHHNALDSTLYLRISPELYLKRLLVGGFDKVYELNRNFRNEGLSPRHNPEFTMLEFYETYQDYLGMMDYTQAMFAELTQALDRPEIECGGESFDLRQAFDRYSLEELLLRHHPSLRAEDLRDRECLLAYAQKNLSSDPGELAEKDAGELLGSLFEDTVEHKLSRPTFVTHYPSSVSALARRNDQDPFVCDRFELFINGQEICNGFSENNDPQYQRDVFEGQLKNHRLVKELALNVDEDFLTALQVGMPPAAGQGIGIDRLVMQLCDSPSIRDVIFFPILREHRAEPENEDDA